MIETVPELASTNAELLGRLRCGETVSEGDWLVAERQTRGRGRTGRTWHDGAGNFMGSTVARLRPGNPAAHTLALVAGLATAQAVAGEIGSAAPLTLKWPNDLLLAGAKLAGILLERQEDAVVVGVGVNLRFAPDVSDRVTTCLKAHCVEVERHAFAQRLADRWAQALARWHGGDWPALRDRWLDLAHPVGSLLSVRGVGDKSLQGRFAGLDGDGAAVLRLADGSAHVIHAGDVEMVSGHAAGD